MTRDNYATSARPSAMRVRQSPLLSGYRYVRLRWRLLFAVIDSLGLCLTAPARLWRLVRQSRPVDPQRILVVQLDHLGDAVLSTGALRTLRRRFPAAQIEALVAPWNRELFAACGDVDRVHVMDVTRFSRHGRGGWILAIARFGWRLRRRRFDLGIDMRGEFPNALLLWLCGAGGGLVGIVAAEASC